MLRPPLDGAMRVAKSPSSSACPRVPGRLDQRLGDDAPESGLLRQFLKKYAGFGVITFSGRTIVLGVKGLMFPGQNGRKQYNKRGLRRIRLNAAEKRQLDGRTETSGRQAY